MEEKIVLILNEMSEYLSIAQMKKLQEVVLKTFSENEADKQEISNNDFLQMFLDAKRIEGCSERTIQYYRVTVEHLFSKMNQSVRRITTEEIRTYLSDYQKINRCSNVTIDNIRRNISSFFSWLEEEDYILKSPMKRIHKIKTKTVVKSVITDEGIEKLRDNCAEIRDLAIIDLLYSTGIRVGELVNLNIEDIDLEGRECIVYGKGDKERRVYFDAKAKVHLKEYIEKRKDNSEALFVTLDAPHDRLQSLLHNNGFPSLMDITLWRRLQHIVRNGNESVHTSKRLTRDNAVLSLNILFDFVEWVDYCYGRDYVERVFDEKKIPDATTDMNVVQEEYRQVIKDVQKNADKIVNEKDKEIERLLALNKELRNEMKVQKARNIKNREYVYEPDLSEWTTRKRYIDADLEANGYVFDQDKKRNCVEVEYPVVGMPNQTGRGYVDYVIWGDTGKIIAVVEAKKASESGDKGRNQGKLYADCIQNMQGKRPIIFYTNGFETYLWDDANSAPRLVSGIFPQKDINAMIERRCIKKSVNSIQIDKQITDRWYQLRAVTKCCENYEKGIRKCLLVMATGTGKTRTAASIVDVMTRSELMGKVLFLADRKELVKQGK